MEIRTPEELAKEGQQAYQQGEYMAAAEKFAAAAAGYASQQQPVLQAEMLNNQSVALLQADQPQQALEVLAGTAAAFEQAGERLKLAMDWGNRAAALNELGQLQEAETAYQNSADLLGELGENQLRADVLKALSALQLRTGRQFEALGTMQAGVSGIKKLSWRQRILKKLLELPSKFMR